MSYYTGLRGEIKLKEGYVKKIDSELNSSEGFYWENVLPEDNLYNNYSRNSFIPCGVVCISAVGWDDNTSLNGDTLSFCCSLKDYDYTIDQFVKYCLPEIGLSWRLEELGEEEISPTVYVKLEDDV